MAPAPAGVGLNVAFSRPEAPAAAAVLQSLHESPRDQPDLHLPRIADDGAAAARGRRLHAATGTGHRRRLRPAAGRAGRFGSHAGTRTVATGRAAARSGVRLRRLRRPALHAALRRALSAAGIDAQRVEQGGLDHGIWTPLRYMWPLADVPVLPLAFVPTWSPRQLFDFGAALAPLAAAGVLVMGTGSITHNLRRVFAAGLGANADAPEIAESAAFRQWMQQRGQATDWDALFDYRRAAPHALVMLPSVEFLLPWYVAAGAAGRESTAL